MSLRLVTLKNLCKLSCPLNLFKCIMNFITNREYHLVIDGWITQHKFTAGSLVPQGPCIGPVLFNIYINDMEQIFREDQTGLLQFADDSKFFRRILNYVSRYVRTPIKTKPGINMVYGKWGGDKSKQITCYECCKRENKEIQYHIFD